MTRTLTLTILTTLALSSTTNTLPLCNQRGFAIKEVNSTTEVKLNISNSLNLINLSNKCSIDLNASNNAITNAIYYYNKWDTGDTLGDLELFEYYKDVANNPYNIKHLNPNNYTIKDVVKYCSDELANYLLLGLRENEEVSDKLSTCIENVDTHSDYSE